MPDAGWYHDEDDPLLARWHDGDDWTEHTIVQAEWAGLGPPPNPVGERPLREYRPLPRRRRLPGPGWLWVAALLAVAVAVGLLLT